VLASFCFGEVNGIVGVAKMFPEGVETLLKNTFACLGLPGVYRNRDGEHRDGEHQVRVLVREQERWAEAGDSAISGSFLSSRITFEVRVADIPVIRVGDTITMGDKIYKVFQEPLKDPTGTIWIVEGMILEGI
jgi:hypothetical protein